MATMHAALRQAVKDMYKKLQMVNLESVRARVGASKRDMNDYRRFLALKAAHEKLNPIAFAHCHFSPTPEIDQIWHAHILDTRLYMDACAAMDAKGAFVHHDPHGGDDLAVQKARREFTKAAFMECYGGLPASKWATTMDLIEGAGRGYDDDDDDDDEEEEEEEGTERPDRQAGEPSLFGDGHDGAKPPEASADSQEPLATRPPKRPRADDLFKIFIKTTLGRTRTLRVSKDTPVKGLKALLHAAGEPPPDQQRLIFAGKQLVDDRTMGDYNIRELGSVYMCLRLRGC